MPKRSRSASPPPTESPDSFTLTRTEEPAIAPAHTPKYRRSTSSPPGQRATIPALSQQMQCALPPHEPITLPSAAAFDVHYAQEHTNRCSACGANLPSSWLLELHLSERHDPLIAGQRAKGEKCVSSFSHDPLHSSLAWLPSLRGSNLYAFNSTNASFLAARR